MLPPSGPAAAPAADGTPWLVVHNPRSGTGSEFDLAAEARYASQRLGRPIRVRMLRPRLSLETLLRGALAEGTTRVIVCGGDGSVRAAAQVLAGTRVPLAVLPGGTFNHFARNLEVPLPLPEAWAVATGGRVIAVDVGSVNGVVFVNNAGLGLYPAMVAERPRWSGRLGKLAAGIVGLVGVLTHFTAPALTISAGDALLTQRAPVVFVGNNRYTGDATEPWRRERMDAGVLHLTLVPGNLLQRLVRSVEALLGFHRPPKLLLEQVVPAFNVSCARGRLAVALDGEVMHLPTPLRYRSLPGALHVVVPAPAEPGTEARPAGRRTVGWNPDF